MRVICSPVASVVEQKVLYRPNAQELVIPCFVSVGAEPDPLPAAEDETPVLEPVGLPPEPHGLIRV